MDEDLGDAVVIVAFEQKRADQKSANGHAEQLFGKSAA